MPLLRAARLVVSVDTALMHLAVAVGAPTIGLASAAFVGEIVPYDPAIQPDNVRFIYHSMPCEGCLGDCVLPAENGMFPCVARLEEDQILAAARSMMSDSIGSGLGFLNVPTSRTVRSMSSVIAKSSGTAARSERACTLT